MTRICEMQFQVQANWRKVNVDWFR